MFEQFPYANFHELNMDWIIKIAKDFLDQYTHIQDTITTGLESLDSKATELEGLLQAWYDTHSEDIANQLADALEDLNRSASEALVTFQNSADAKAQQAIASIPADYTTLSNDVINIKTLLDPSIFLESGSFYDPDGKTKVENTSRIRNATILPIAQIDSISFNTDFSVWLFYLNNNQTLITSSGEWLSSPLRPENFPTNTHYINLAFRKTATPQTDITSDIPTLQNSIQIVSSSDKMFTLGQTVNLLKKQHETYNIIPGWIYDGKTMQQDGSITDSTTWCRSKLIPVEPNTEYKIVSFARKNKQIANSYFNFYDAYGNRIRSTQRYDTNTVTTPPNIYYCVISCNTEESKYVTLSKEYPMWFSRFGQDSTFNVQSRYNNNYDGYSWNWAKNGINQLATIPVSPIYPHGSKWSYISALYEGFDSILIDLIKTSDGHYVTSHEDNISSLAKRADGTALTNYKISEHTLAEVKALDFGYDYGPMYKGTHIQSLEEALELVKYLRLNVVIEPVSSISREDYGTLANIAKEYGFYKNIIFFGYSANKLSIIKDVLPEAGVMLYVSGNASYVDALITDAITLKAEKNTVICNAFADTSLNTLTETQIRRMMSNNLRYSVSTPPTEPDGFIDFMSNAPMALYATYFGTQVIPAYKMLTDSAID